MPRVLSILFGCGFTLAVCWAAGTLLLRGLGLRFHRGEERVLGLVTGSACLSLAVFALAAGKAARPGVFLALGLGVLAAAAWRGAYRGEGEPLPPLGRFHKALFGLVFAPFFCLYFFNALAPEISADGAAYHLGMVARYLSAHGFYRITTNMYANLSEGTELLYLFAFAFGRHSAAAMVHLGFLVALPFAMLYYARRFSLAGAGATGALLVFLSPIVGFDGSTAFIDVAVTCVLFTLFYFLQVWDRERTAALLAPIGLLAGFAYAMKYTAAVAVPYAVLFVGWKLYRKHRRVRELARPLALVSACALLMMAPWMVKNWIVVGNPFSPFFNKIFPNPNIRIQFETEYREQLANWGNLKSKWDIPVEATVRGEKLNGFLGPVFLLAPLALIALRWRTGRQLLLAAGVFLLPYPTNIGTRFLIAPLPFLSLALAMVVGNWKAMAPALVIFHALASWPSMMRLYCDTYALRIQEIPVRAALRLEPEDEFLASRSGGYPMSRLIEQLVPRDAKIFAFSAPPEAYTTRDILVAYEGGWNNTLNEILWAGAAPDKQPIELRIFRPGEVTVRRLRVLQTASDPSQNWSVSELRVYRGDKELPREAQWRLRAHPNPWDVQMAFDNSPVTRWKSWQPLAPGMWLEVDFGRRQTLDRVVLECTPDQPGVRLALEADHGGGDWVRLGGEPEKAGAEPPGGMRWLAAQELRWQGVEYILMEDHDGLAQDIRGNAVLWGVKQVAEKNGYRLYQVQ